MSLFGASSALAAQKGVIVSEEAVVFQNPDFDSTTLATLKGGQIFDISDGKKGAFYKVRVKPGMIGWVADSDIRPLSASAVKKIEDRTTKQKTARAEKKARPVDKSKPIEKARFRGIALEMMSFRENTMGSTRSDSMLMYGGRFSGPGLLWNDVDYYLDAEFLFHSGAPKYYSSATGNGAGGFLLNGNVLFIADFPQSRHVMAFAGAGPMLKISHFEVTLDNDPSPGQSHSYSLDDYTIGVVFAGGLVYGWDHYAVRLDARYYWETQRYPSLGLAFQMEF